MQLNGFELFALSVCSCLLGTCLFVWRNIADRISDREISLVFAIYAALALSMIVSLRSEKTLIEYISGDAKRISDSQIIELQEAHRKRIASLKYENQTCQRQLQSSLNRANAKIDRINHEFDWVTDMYQDQMRVAQEQDDRITYLETKLQETGQRSPAVHAPFSAPSSQINFANPPRRNRSLLAVGNASSIVSSPLAQVPENAAE
ncbi:hypothetical protein P153DRAFT_390040 [Dothidotthia symphoricarpi CBS 119687]|uniref:Uncharacterized protein n=1 Tax=Dothidotthia symphoricarpi CBS 119687 TaxID=1392245 RepID=A0A6A6A3N0_9PLEO|nr:uncharacterized protein P153DRAFT_390040 [Dothidotthia symphoricarpi CBS 119687]KAF2125191.1 hypothetical protein P153DRAFT_390040 [Dothidotthia symphoricarpi CBS 119687]